MQGSQLDTQIGCSCQVSESTTQDVTISRQLGVAMTASQLEVLISPALIHDGVSLVRFPN